MAELWGMSELGVTMLAELLSSSFLQILNDIGDPSQVVWHVVIEIPENSSSCTGSSSQQVISGIQLAWHSDYGDR